jgi:hypothetical protein
MISRSNQILRPIDIGDNVTIPIPSVDKGGGDRRNILYLVTHFSSHTEQYKLGTRHGLLNSTFSMSQFMSSIFHGFSEGEVDSNTEISVREAARLQSIGDGECFAKCSCKTGCARKTCKCVRSNVLCISRCHNSNSCQNK